MATLPFVGPAIRHRKPMTGARMIIVASAVAFFIFIIWASLAQVDEVTRGEGKVIP
jgi:adhesin transport system membrane fusion protein